jgi:hypothetical protein
MAGGSAYAGQGAKRSDALLRFYNERLAAYGNDPFAASAAAAAQPDTTSLQNQLQQNTTALNNSSKRLEELEKVNKQFQEVIKPAAEEQQAAVRGTLATTLQAQQEAQRIERIRAQVTAEVLNTGRGRLAAQLTEAVAPTIGSSVRGVLQQLFQGESFDLAGLAEGISRSMAERFTGALVDAALAPIEKAITGNLFKQLSGVDLEERARLAAQREAADGQQRAAELQVKAGELQIQAAQGGTAGATALPFTGSTPAAADLPFQGDAFTMEPLQVALTTSAEGFGQSMDAASDAIDVVATTAGQAAGGFESLMQSFGRVTAVLGGVAMGIGGAQQMRKGGTYNTLMGLAGIFGSIGSIAGLFGGAARPAAAATGFNPGVYTMPMLTGVPSFAGGGYTGAGAMAGGMDGKGGFMAMLHPNETVVPGNPYSATAAALGGGGAGAIRPMNNEPIRFESTVINGIEFVTRAEAEEIGRRSEARGAERGTAMTLSRIRNSVKTRKQSGF